MCGEQIHSRSSFLLTRGSPPRVRGTDSFKIVLSAYAGITPACAGNRYNPRQRGRAVEDHPRVCGEQCHPHSGGGFPCGSPPRVRGTAGVNVPLLVKYRITPACAGNRIARWICGANIKDHPRVCGEQNVATCLLVPQAGSPPRVRGTVIPQLQKPPGFGITPACAGNRSGALETLQQAKDHPRVCGEQWYKLFILRLLDGSPPRVRGTVADVKAILGGDGITPACAGNSQTCQSVKLRC